MSDVFISFKNLDENVPTKDSIIATQLHDYFIMSGIDTFMSNSSLVELGNSRFKEEIDKALDESTYLILVGTKQKYICSPWVKYEWDVYYQDIISGRKNGELFCVFDNFDGDIPRSLRYQQRFSADNTGFSLLVGYISKGLGRVKTNDVFICRNCGKVVSSDDISGCRYHPQSPIVYEERNFDSSYTEYLVYPCCGKKIEKILHNTTDHSGCRFGNHQK